MKNLYQFHKQGLLHLEQTWKFDCFNDFFIDFWCLTPLSAIFQLYHGDQF
jgi:hypothetical protein